MNTAQLLEYYKDKNLNERFRYTTNQNQDYFPFDENLNTDWQDAIFQNAIQQKYNCLSLEEVKICVTESQANISTKKGS